MKSDSLTIPVYFGRKWLIFFMLLETSTVPLVAVSNDFAVKNIYYMSIMGFLVAFVVIWLLIKFLQKLMVKHSQELFGIAAKQVSGGWIIAILAGILEMVMFAVQDWLFHRGWDDYRVGFASAFISVGVTLLIYRGLLLFGKLAIRLHTAKRRLVFSFAWRDIVKLALIFGCYEAIVCPITGLWIPYPAHRLSLGILSGIIGGFSGGCLLWFICHFIRPLQPQFTLQPQVRAALDEVSPE